MQLGKYKIFKDILLGSGAFSKVYLGYDTDKHRNVAVKILDKQSEKIKRKIILKEIGILRNLHHKSVIDLYDFLEDEYSFYIILTYVPLTLKQFEKENHPLSENFILAVMSQLIDALEYIHSKGIAHMDIKLSNILIDEQLNVYFSDFGLSEESLDYDILLKRYKGSLLYSAPEVHATRKIHKQYSAYKADIWSLGICMYMLLNGVPPFVGEKETIGDVIKNTPLLIKRSDISYVSRTLLRKMLEKNPDKRPTIYEVQNIIESAPIYTISSLQKYLTEEYNQHYSEETVKECIKRIKKPKGVSNNQIIKALIPNKFFL